VSTRRGILPLLASLVLIASPASAVELNEWVPGLRVTLFVTERLEYETNVFQTREAQDDLISRTVPGFLLDYGRGPITFSAGYRAEILRFLDLTSQDDEHHIAVGQFRLELPRLEIDVRDDLTITSDPPTSELTGRIDSTTNVLKPEAKYKLTERLFVGLGHTWTHVNFERSVAELNREEHLTSGKVGWKIRPRADLTLEYGYGTKEFDVAERDVTRHVVGVGLTGELSPKFSSAFTFGYEVRQADGRDAEDTSGLVFGGSLTYRPTERTSLTLYATRSFEESTFTTRGLFFESTTGTLTVQQQFTRKLSANLRATLAENDYPTKTSGGLDDRSRFRNDIFFGWGGGVEYEIQKWLVVGAEYSHSRRNSNFSEFDYKDDKFTGKVTLQF
jgi:hypothetical protein